MSESALGGLILAVVYVAIGLAVVALARAGERRTLDWSWGGHTAANTPPQVWDAAHRAAAPGMRRAGVLFMLAGIVAGSLMAWREAAGGIALAILTIAALWAMFASIGNGLRVLAEPTAEVDRGS